MPQFHFHVHTNVHARDEEGVFLPDLDAAKKVALEGVRCLMSNDIKYTGRVCLSHHIEITDAEGKRLHIVRYGDGVEIDP